MNQFKIFSLLFVTFISFNMFSQESELNYPTDLPFQTQNDSEYYHLESSLLLRTIVKDIVEVLEKAKDNKEAQHFTINFKSSKGAQLPINYTVNQKKLNSIFSSNSAKNKFMKETYDWMNRSFRSNIPFRD
ncbi:hypothetical protein OAV72_00560 [Flavobacteriaceae bacterium]|nr:hypothetical protein [Flavobacteriaceae bacterium]MDC1056420.1 hypothetical protein [Flavobacteriaceae bacterium]MDC3368782.1 hypothetical protein [Flavobacteriaceae bacterium]